MSSNTKAHALGQKLVNFKTRFSDILSRKQNGQIVGQSSFNFLILTYVMGHEVKISMTYTIHSPVTLPYILHVLSTQAFFIILGEIAIYQAISKYSLTYRRNTLLIAVFLG